MGSKWREHLAMKEVPCMLHSILVGAVFAAVVLAPYAIAKYGSGDTREKTRDVSELDLKG